LETTKFDSANRVKLRNMGYKTEKDIMYKQFLHGFKLIIDFASHDIGVIRIEGKSFYMTIRQFQRLGIEIRMEIEMLKQKGVVK